MDIHGDEALYGQVPYPVAFGPYPTLPYPRGLGALWASALPCRLWALPYPTLDMETVHAHGDSSGHPRGLGALWAGRTPSRLCPLTHGDSLCPWRQFIAQSRGWSALWASALPCRLCPLTMETVSREEAHSSMWFHTLSYAIEFHRTFFNRDSFTGIKYLVRQLKFILVFSPFIHIPSTGILAFSLIFLSLSSSFPSLLSSSSTWHRIPSNQSPFTGIYSCIRSTNHLLPLLLSSHSNFFHYNQLSSSFHHLCLFCVSSFPFLFLLLFLCSTNQLLILNDDASRFLFFSIEWWRTLIHQ